MENLARIGDQLAALETALAAARTETAPERRTIALAVVGRATDAVRAEYTAAAEQADQQPQMTPDPHASRRPLLRVIQGGAGGLAGMVLGIWLRPGQAMVTGTVAAALSTAALFGPMTLTPHAPPAEHHPPAMATTEPAGNDDQEQALPEGQEPAATRRPQAQGTRDAQLSGDDAQEPESSPTASPSPSPTPSPSAGWAPTGPSSVSPSPSPTASQSGEEQDQDDDQADETGDVVGPPVLPDPQPSTSPSPSGPPSDAIGRPGDTGRGPDTGPPVDTPVEAEGRPR